METGHAWWDMAPLRWKGGSGMSHRNLKRDRRRLASNKASLPRAGRGGAVNRRPQHIGGDNRHQRHR
jgi:hypothetical protein